MKRLTLAVLLLACSTVPPVNSQQQGPREIVRQHVSRIRDFSSDILKIVVQSEPKQISVTLSNGKFFDRTSPATAAELAALKAEAVALADSLEEEAISLKAFVNSL